MQDLIAKRQLMSGFIFLVSLYFLEKLIIIKDEYNSLKYEYI